MTTLSEVLEHYEPVIGIEIHAQLKTKSNAYIALSRHHVLVCYILIFDSSVLD